MPWNSSRSILQAKESELSQNSKNVSFLLSSLGIGICEEPPLEERVGQIEADSMPEIELGMPAV